MKGEFERRLILMIGKGKYDSQRIRYLGEVADMVDKARKEFPWDVLCNVGHPMFQPDEARLRKWCKKYFLGT